MPHSLRLLFLLTLQTFRSRRDLLLENLALWQQLTALARRHPQPRFSQSDRFFWVALRRLWPGWRRALILVQPDTVLRWHRAGFKLDWQSLSLHRVQMRRRCVRRDYANLSSVWAENRTWGAPRIHDQLKMLGLDISERTSCGR